MRAKKTVRGGGGRALAGEMPNAAGYLLKELGSAMHISPGIRAYDMQP